MKEIEEQIAEIIHTGLSNNICPDFDAFCFEPNRSGCEDGITLPLIGICPMWDSNNGS